MSLTCWFCRGDITDHGDAESFAKTAALLKDCPFPIIPMVGNHDTREGLLGAFAQITAGRNGGLPAFRDRGAAGPARHLPRYPRGWPPRRRLLRGRGARWLAARLAEAPRSAHADLHAPPAGGRRDRLDGPRAGRAVDYPPSHEVLSGQTQVQAIHCGHAAPPRSPRSFAGIPLGGDALGRAAGGDGPEPDRQPSGRRTRALSPPSRRPMRCTAGTARGWSRITSGWATGRCWRASTPGCKPMIEGMFAERD